MITFAIIIAGAAWIGSMIALSRPFEGEKRPFRLRPQGGALFGGLVGLLFCLVFVDRSGSSGAAGTEPTSMDGNVVAIHSAAGFDEAVLGSAVPVLVEFYSDNCRYCKEVSPILSEIADRLAEQEPPVAVISQVNIDNNYGLSEKYRIMGLPDIRIFVGGEEKAQLVGYHPKEDYLEALGKVADLSSVRDVPSQDQENNSVGDTPSQDQEKQAD